MTFSSRLPTEYGWAERRAVTLGVDGGQFTGRPGADAPIVLARATGVAFDYLLEPGADSRWVGTWSSPVSAPLAVRVRLSHDGGVDTALYLIKGRG